MPAMFLLQVVKDEAGVFFNLRDADKTTSRDGEPVALVSNGAQAPNAGRPGKDATSWARAVRRAAVRKGRKRGELSEGLWG